MKLDTKIHINYWQQHLHKNVGIHEIQLVWSKFVSVTCKFTCKLTH